MLAIVTQLKKFHRSYAASAPPCLCSSGPPPQPPPHSPVRRLSSGEPPSPLRRRASLAPFGQQKKSWMRPLDSYRPRRSVAPRAGGPGAIPDKGQVRGAAGAPYAEAIRARTSWHPRGHPLRGRPPSWPRDVPEHPGIHADVRRSGRTSPAWASPAWAFPAIASPAWASLALGPPCPGRRPARRAKASWHKRRTVGADSPNSLAGWQG